MPHDFPHVPDGLSHDPEVLAAQEGAAPFSGCIRTSASGMSTRASKEEAEWLLRGTRNEPGGLALGEAFVHHEDPVARRASLSGPGPVTLSRAWLRLNLLAVGPPGSGKTTGWLLTLLEAAIASLAHGPRSIVVIDMKRDLYPLVQALMRHHGIKDVPVRRINFADAEVSLGWNPIPAEVSKTEAVEIATRIVDAADPSPGRDSTYFRNTSIRLFANIILALRDDAEEDCTIPRVLEVLGQPGSALVSWLRRHGLHADASYIDGGGQNSETSMQDLLTRLLPLQDEQLQTVLAHSTYDVGETFERPTITVVEVDETRLKVMRPFLGSLVSAILDAGIRHADSQVDHRLPHPVHLVIDEFGSTIGPLPSLPAYLNSIRSRDISLVCGVQTLSQIDAAYGRDARSILNAFQTKVFLPGCSHDDASYASRETGKMQVILPPTDDVPACRMERPVYRIEEVMRPPSHATLGPPALLIGPAYETFWVYMLPIFRRLELRPALEAARRAAHEERERRARGEPIEKEAFDPSVDPSSWQLSRVRRAIARLERELAIEECAPAVLTRWTALRESLKTELASYLRLLGELERLEASPEEYLDARDLACTADVEASLQFLKFLRIVGPAHLQAIIDAAERPGAPPSSPAAPNAATPPSLDQLTSFLELHDELQRRLDSTEDTSDFEEDDIPF